ncbi:MAG: sulfur carrier protein ThiS [Chloroflexota bacterium]|nr:sulfur carrier protein ThiS [Dehalococcoidia bacterium]MDW8254732.1 sulfur carrier protein ThiS [Chloroflexota bacterium]
MTIGGLLVVSDRRLTGAEGLVDALVEAAAGGATAVQLREPDLPARQQYELACALRARLPAGVLLFVNERVDIALAAGADGVQLPTGGLPVAAVRRIAPRLIVGRSVHAVTDLDEADFFIVGTIYPSRSHPDRPASGLDLLRAVRAATSKPLLAIGGITAERAPDVRVAGADGVAVISAVLGAADRRDAAAAIARAFGGTTMIRVQLNGAPREIPAGMTVAALLESLKVDPRIVAVELSGEIVARERFSETVIADGATIEIVRMIGGG